MDQASGRRAVAVFVGLGVLLAVGGGLRLAGSGLAALPWAVATVAGLVVAASTTVRALARRRPSVDVVAVLALLGSMAVGEWLAGAVVALMLSSGQLLEARAAARARHDLGLLASRVPRTAALLLDGGVVEVPLEQVRPGDRVLVRTGEVLGVDGRLCGPGLLDESVLTGEPLPVERGTGGDVRSGVVVAGAPVEVLVTRAAAESTYAGVVRLVEQAEADSAPLVRAADRYAVGFVPLAVLVAGLAWAWAGDPVRAVAVLVVATPCPLLLAAPVAIMSGLSRAARTGVVVKDGAALEALAAGRVLVLDKTGTLTRGRPSVSSVVAPDGGPGADEVLRLAASLDQASAHVMAGAVVRAAADRGLSLSIPAGVREEHGYGLEGEVEGHLVRVGSATWAGADGAGQDWVVRARRRADLDSSLTVFVAVDGRPAAVLLLEDPLRGDAPRTVRTLRAAGFERVVLLSGDRSGQARRVGRLVGADEVLAGHDPQAKVAAVRAEAARGVTVMVGDGVNDAPALAAAQVGVALAARGATASSEAADVVLTVDRVDALADAVLVARRSHTIALQAAWLGMGLSFVAMAAAAGGLLAPAAGALAQEGIDVLALAVALRALLPAGGPARLDAADLDTLARLRREHDAVAGLVEQLRTTADALLDSTQDLTPARRLLAELDRVLVPHEQAEEDELLPVLARAAGTPEATVGLSRTHAEIEQQVAVLRRLLGGPEQSRHATEDVVELRRVLYGLYSVLRLHAAQEEEEVFSLAR